MSASRSESILDHIPGKHNRSGIHSIRADSLRHPLIVTACQLVIASPLVILSLRRPLVVLSSRRLAVASPLAVLPLCHPLVLLSRQLVVTSPLLVISLHHPLVLTRAGWSLHRLSSSSRCAPKPPTRPPLVAPAGRCVASRCAALSSSHRLIAMPSHVSLRPLVVASSLIVLLLRRPPGPLIVSADCCVASSWRHPLILSLRRLSSPRHQLAVVHRRCHQTPLPPNANTHLRPLPPPNAYARCENI